MSLRYDDFDLQIEPAGRKYRVRLLNAPTGQATAEFALPFTDVEVSNFLNRIGQVRRTMRRVDAPELGAAKEFGGKLFNAVFSGEMFAQLRGSMERAIDSDRGLRLRLRLTDVPALADLPWEFLYDANQNQFLTISSETPLVRFLDLPQRIAPLRVSLPLRVLVVIAGPRNLKRLDVEGEWQRVTESLGELSGSGQLELERLPSATLDALRLCARGAPFHILHFIGHGGFDIVAQDGVLQFEDESGMSYPVRGEMLGMLLHDHRSLRLAVLNACEGARSSRQDPFSGVAQSLLQQRVPAVIAMQFEISDAAAKVFAQEFYHAVAEGNPVDAALSESRKALFKEEFGQEWAIPVLYMRAQEGVLFELQRATAAASAAQISGRTVADSERLAAESAAAERALRAEQERLAREQAERDRLAREAAEAERRAAEAAVAAEAERAAKAEQERLALANAERERLASLAAEAARHAAERTELERKRRQAERAAARAAALKHVFTTLQQVAHERLTPRAWVYILVPIVVLGLALGLPRYFKTRSAAPLNNEPRSFTAEAPTGPANVGEVKRAAPEAIPVKPDLSEVHAVPAVSDVEMNADAKPPATAASRVLPEKHPAYSSAPTLIHEAEGVQAARLLKRVNPVYPLLSRAARTSGTVRLDAVLAKDGTVKKLSVTSGNPLLVQATIDAVRQWRYQPTLVNGQPVEVETPIDVVYTLTENTPPNNMAPATRPAPPPASSTAAGAAPPADSAAGASSCSLGNAVFKDQGNRLTVSVPYSYQGGYPLSSIGVRGLALSAAKQPVPGLAYSQFGPQAASGTAEFHIEGHPSLSHAGPRSEYVFVAIVGMQSGTAQTLCSRVVPYQRQW
ncbi:MAG: TonB family protein [Candidatus Acidiferrales bacterium]